VYTEVPAFAGWLAARGVAPEGASLVAGDGARIPAHGTVGKASRYPLAVEVEGFEGDLGAVSVELLGLTHGRPSDLDVWLVGPDGTTVVVLSDAGGADAVDDIDLLIVDGAAAAGSSALSSPVGPTDREADRQRRDARAERSLGAFAGASPNGTWELLVADDRGGASGALDGWRLHLR
jgi:subtilisin-like proprotein convertase family protein